MNGLLDVVGMPGLLGNTEEMMSQVNTSDSRLLECLVTLDPTPSPPRYGQSMRVRIHGSPRLLLAFGKCFPT